ncbi:MAG: hypothetical protein WD823_08410 [Sulfuricaulis sp.]|uniref:hypothetical protein n=1 Tax=Sulfuricaulis sp. TaxID=2003553 RepID=UPI0034A1C6EE
MLALALLVSCGKKEEKVPAAAQPQSTQAAKLIDETKRNAEALKAQQAGPGAAAVPYSQLPGLLDQLASHMEARAQARQQGADTTQADTQIADDVTQLQEIQNNMAAFQPEAEKKPALDRLSENLTKVIDIVRQGQDLKTTVKSIKGGSEIQPGATKDEYPSQGDFTQSSDTLVAATEASTPAATPQETPAAPLAQTQTAAAEQAQPMVKQAPAISPSSCCSVVPNPTMKGRLGRLVVTYPAGTKAGARIGVSKGDAEATSGYGDKAFELLPGSYTVIISGKRVDNVTVQSGHDTKVKVGVLRVTAPGGTRIGVLDKDGKTELTSGYGNKEFGLPIGTVYVSVAGQSEAVAIKEGQITDF